MYDGNKTDIKCFQEEYDTNNPETFDIGLKNHTNVWKRCSTYPEFVSLWVTEFKDDYRTRYVQTPAVADSPSTNKAWNSLNILKLKIFCQLLLIISLKLKSAVTTMVSICMYVCIYVCVYVRIYVCVCMYVGMYVYITYACILCVYICMYYVCLCMYVLCMFMYVCMHAWMPVCMCIYMYVYMGVYAIWKPSCMHSHDSDAIFNCVTHSLYS